MSDRGRGERPVCACGKSLPNFSMQSVGVLYADPSTFTITGVTFHVRCTCGATWDLKKTPNTQPAPATLAPCSTKEEP
jgi:hypothetical protein